MSDTFRALVIDKTDDGQATEIKQIGLDDLMEGDVVVDVSCSTVNFKDGLAITGASPVVRSFPMVGGIDLAGTVSETSYPGIMVGDRVVVNGWGLSERHFGGYAEKARVSGDWLVILPSSFSFEQAMAIGTAGYTAMLCVMALEDNGVTPSDGPILVTGAAGGVGSVAVAILSKLGFEVVASTGRPEEADYLKGLGASEILDRSEFSDDPKPLAKERFAGVVDVAGGKTLANAISQTKYGGTVAACGLAESIALPTTVMPFILRGVTLAGVDSVMAPREIRTRAWHRLAEDLDLGKLEAMSETIGLSDVPSVAGDILQGKVRGRIIVDIKK